VHFIQKGRQFLDLVDDDERRGPAAVTLPEQRRPTRILPEDVGLEEVDERRIRELLPDPEALADPTRPPKKGRFPPRQADAQQAFVDHTRGGSLSG
jgi:hypothetical protein